MTLLPAQLRRLAQEASTLGGAIAIAQDGSTVHVDTGRSQFSINARGADIDPQKEHLFAEESDHVREL